MDITRRTAMKTVGAGIAGSLLAGTKLHAEEAAVSDKVNGNINQSVCRWCYSKIPLETLAADVKKIGFKSLELLSPDEYLKVKPLGLTCAMLSQIGTITDNFNRKEHHDELVAQGRKLIEFAAAQELPNVICFSGNRKGLPDDEGLKNCAEGLKRLMSYAEEKRVTVCMELLNSKRNHADYQCDHTAWGVQLVKAVGSPRFKLLYDIYHMQIMEGDVIDTIKENKDFIAHYHTGGVPGRAEIDETQELQYPAIMKAIIATGYKGFVAQEFIPKHEAMASLAAAFKICDV